MGLVFWICCVLCLVSVVCGRKMGRRQCFRTVKGVAKQQVTSIRCRQIYHSEIIDETFWNPVVRQQGCKMEGDVHGCSTLARLLRFCRCCCWAAAVAAVIASRSWRA